MTTKQERTKQASAAIDALFKSNPEQSKKQVAIDVATERSDIRRRRKAAPIEEQEAIKAKPTESTSKASPRREIDVARLPVLDAPWLKIQERVFTIADPDREFEDLRERLKLTEALTPMNLETALNNAEDCARRAHALYINARLEFEAYEHEMTPVLEAMREAANSDLQDEKRRGERSKAITNEDLNGRASVLFPDEWGMVVKRKRQIEAALEHLKVFADLWKQRCYSLSTMLNAGKRV